MIACRISAAQAPKSTCRRGSLRARKRAAIDVLSGSSARKMANATEAITVRDILIPQSTKRLIDAEERLLPGTGSLLWAAPLLQSVVGYGSVLVSGRVARFYRWTANLKTERRLVGTGRLPARW